MATNLEVRSARRRGTRRGDVKEQAILATAERLLAERPLGEVSVDELARGAGISRPTFYFYFESKEAVLRALLERVADELFRTTEAPQRDPGEPRRRAIRSAVEASLALWRRHGAVLGAAFVARETVPEMRALYDSLLARFVDAAAERIRRDRRLGLAPPGPPSARALAMALTAMNERCLYASASSSDGWLSPRELVGTLTAVWVRAIYGTDDPRPS